MTDDIVTQAVDQAYQEVPEPRLSLKVRVALFIAGVLLVLNTGVNALNYAHLASVSACNQKATVAGRVTAQADREVVDTFFDKIAKDLVPGHFNPEAISEALTDYNSDRATNDAARNVIYNKSC